MLNKKASRIREKVYGNHLFFLLFPVGMLLSSVFDKNEREEYNSGARAEVIVIKWTVPPNLMAVTTLERT